MIGAPPAYWINRAEDETRRQRMTAWLEDHRMPHVRIEAVTPEAGFDVKVRKHHSGLTKKVEVACVASHLKAVQQAQDDGHNVALIMEDDIHPVCRFDFAALMESAPPDWQVLQLHLINAPFVERLGKIYRQFGVHWQEWETPHHSCAAYLVNKDGMARLSALYMPEEGYIDLSIIQAVRRLTAEYVIYKRTASYSSTVPLFLHDPSLGSALHPENLGRHQEALEMNEAVIAAIGNQVAEAGTGAVYPFAVAEA